ncbi:MAG: hypothetical protein WDN08_15370 [Rhizomicrobium sp.]
MAAGALATRRPRTTSRSVRSSDTKTAPSAISRNARSDLPAPLGPTIRTPARAGAPNARPARPIRMQVAWDVDAHQRASGSSTMKRAPPWVRFSARMLPPAASAI